MSGRVRRLWLQVNKKNAAAIRFYRSAGFDVFREGSAWLMLVPPPISPARGPPTDWGELMQVHDDRDVFQASPNELPAIVIRSL
jgi:hypothetical protein